MTLVESASVVLTVIALSVSISSCDAPPENACPVLQGTTDPTGGGIVWGGDAAKVTAQISSVAVECIPRTQPAIETEKVKRGPYTEYEIAATAAVNYQIKDKEFVDQFPGNLEANIIFEAVSQAGVVLGSATGRFRIVANGVAGTSSARIGSLADSEIRRVVAVRAKWEYGAR